MIKRMLCLAGLVLGPSIMFVNGAGAQDFTALPLKQTIQQSVPQPVPPQNPTSLTSAAGKPAASRAATGPVSQAGKDPTTCGNPAGPCLFYGGDFNTDPLLSPFLPNGLSNENDLVNSGTPYAAAVWVPFTVPAGKGWKVSALFANNLSSFGVLDQTPNTPAAAAYYAVSSGVSSGNPGTLIDAGIAAATSTPTGRSAFGLTEYTIEVTGLNFELAPGTYWMAVVPQCTNSANPQCHGRFFLSDVEYVNALPNGNGPPEPEDQSFFDSSLFFAAFEPTYGPAGACFGEGCDAYSAGVIGTEIGR